MSSSTSPARERPVNIDDLQRTSLDALFEALYNDSEKLLATSLYVLHNLVDTKRFYEVFLVTLSRGASHQNFAAMVVTSCKCLFSLIEVTEAMKAELLEMVPAEQHDAIEMLLYEAQQNKPSAPDTNIILSLS